MIDPDHDTLIAGFARIDAKQDALSQMLQSHMREEAEDRTVIKRDITAAHRRIDQVTFQGVLALFGIVITGIGIIVSVWVKK